MTLPLLMGRELCWRCFILRACVCSVRFLFEDVLVEYRVPLRLDLPVSLVHEAIFSHSVLPLTQVAYFVNLSHFRKVRVGQNFLFQRADMKIPVPTVHTGCLLAKKHTRYNDTYPYLPTCSFAMQVVRYQPFIHL